MSYSFFALTYSQNQWQQALKYIKDICWSFLFHQVILEACIFINFQDHEMSWYLHAYCDRFFISDPVQSAGFWTTKVLRQICRQDVFKLHWLSFHCESFYLFNSHGMKEMDNLLTYPFVRIERHKWYIPS